MKINLINNGVSRPVSDLITARIRDGLDSEFTLGFTLTEIDTPYIHDNTLVQYGEQYFNVIGYQKDREGQSPTCAVECEHVSYSLNDDEYKLEKFVYSGSTAGALAAVLSGTPLTAGTVEPTGTVNISLTGGTRKAILISVAAIIGGEIEYSGYTVNLRRHRGSAEYIELLGTDNVTDVSYSRNVLNGTTTYNIQLGRKTILSCGDNVHIKFTPLEIDVQTRITAIEYNPYNTHEVEIEVGDYIPDILDNLQKTQTKAETALKTATDTANSLSGYTKKSEISASLDTYVNSEAGRASIVASLSGTYVTESDLTGYVEKTELSAEIGAYIDTQAGTAKIVNNLSGTFVKEDSLGNYVQKTDLNAGIESYIDTQAGTAKVVSAVSGTYVTQSNLSGTLGNYAKKSDIPDVSGFVEKTELSAEIGSYIDTAAGTAKIVSAASGTYQKKSDMGNYVTTNTLNTSIGQYIDTTAGKAKIVSACSGEFVTESDLSGYAKTSALATIEQSISDVAAEISLTASYGSGSIGSNVRALLTLVTNADSSSIKLKADAIEIDGSLYLKASDYLASGTTTIKGSKIQTSDLYIQQLRTTAGKFIIDYSGSTLSLGGGTTYSSGSFASFSYVDIMVSSGIRIGYGTYNCIFAYESAHFILRPYTSNTQFDIGASTYPVRYIYCDYLYVDGVRVTGSGSSSSTDTLEETDIKRIYANLSTSKYIELSSSNVLVPSSSGFGLGTTTYPFQTLYIGTGSAYHWKFEASAILPSSTSTSYFNIGSSTYPVNKLYARQIYLNGTELKSGSSSSSSSNPTKLFYSESSTTYYVAATSGYALVPSHCTSYSHWNLGSSSYYWYDCYLGYGSTRIGYNTSSKLGFFGTTPVAKQTVSSSATIETLITALKAYGLI